MKVALVYDRINKWGGAERVLLALHELFPNAPLYTSVYNASKAPWANVFDIKTSYLQEFPYASSFHEWYAPVMPLAFEEFSFEEYDVVISVTSEAAKGIITKPKTLHVCYCLTPTRYLWSGHDEYFKDSLFLLAAKPIVSYLRTWDKVAAQRPDAYISISDEVKKRIKKYYKRDSLLIYPPVALNELPASGRGIENDNNGFFLVVARLSQFTQYKRIDLAIQACTQLGLPLKIVGTGSWEDELRGMAGPTVEFLGSLTDKELVRYYRSCRALVFPGKEDFGLAILEAQNFGKPVIAFKGGGALETVIEGKTGIFFKEQTKESLIEALQIFDKKKFDAADCCAQAKLFSKQNFKKQFLRTIESLNRSHKKNL